MLTFTISLALCRMYCKFRTKTIGSRIIRVLVIPTMVVVIVTSFMIVPEWFILSAVPSKSLSKVGSFSGWLRNVTVIVTASTIGMLLSEFMYTSQHTCVCTAGKLCTQNENRMNSKLFIPRKWPVSTLKQCIPVSIHQSLRLLQWTTASILLTPPATFPIHRSLQNALLQNPLH